MESASSFTYRVSSQMVTAFLDEEFVGFLSWRENTVVHLSVREPYRRLGVASRMFHLARQACPDLQHSDNLTDAGAKFVDSNRRRYGDA